MLEFKATLRISSTKHTLQELRGVLGEPTRGYSVGGLNKKGDRKRKTSLWALESSKAPKEDFDAHLEELLGFLDEKYPLLQSLTDYQMDVFCMFSSDNGQGGAMLPASTMTRLAGYNLDLTFDIYADQ